MKYCNNCESCKFYLRFFIEDENGINFFGGHCTKNCKSENCILWGQRKNKKEDNLQKITESIKAVINELKERNELIKNLNKPTN